MAKQSKQQKQTQQSVVTLASPGPASRKPPVVKNVMSTIKRHLAGTPKQGMPVETANYKKFSKGK